MRLRGKEVDKLPRKLYNGGRTKEKKDGFHTAFFTEVFMQTDFKEYVPYYVKTFERLVNTPSPSGYYTEILPVLRELARETGAEFERTKKGCAVLTLKGKSAETLGLCAHADTLGAMVRGIGANGSLTFSKVGGPILPTLDGEYCTVITREGKKYSGTFLSTSPAAHVNRDSATKERTEETMYIRLDEKVATPADVRALGIESGDYVAYDPKFVFTESGFIKSRFIDDKASVAAFFTVLKYVSDKRIVPERTVKFLVTLYEEVGHGASYVPENLVSMLGVDMGCIGSDLNCTEHDVSVCAKDSRGPYDYDLTSRLISLAKENKLSYAVDVYPYYGSDVGAMWAAGYDVPGALVGTGVHASHGMERTHIDGVLNTLKLIALYLGV